jgi:hypothetical protein
MFRFHSRFAACLCSAGEERQPHWVNMCGSMYADMAGPSPGAGGVEIHHISEECNANRRPCAVDVPSADA